MENAVKEESKNKNLIIGVLVFIIIILLVALIYFVFIKKDKNEVINDNQPQNNTQVSYSKIDETKDNYYVVEGQSYDVYNTKEGNEQGWVVDKMSDKKINLNYPVININTNSVLSTNEKIKKDFSDIENEFKNKLDGGCICVKVNDYYHCDFHIIEPSFKVYEDDKFITVVIRSTYLTNCASGYSKDKVYTVSKKEGREFTDSDLINYFGYSRETINKELPKYIQSLYAIDISAELEDIQDNLIFTIYNGKLVMGYYMVSGTRYFSYDGTSFKEENSFEILSN